MGGYVPDVLSLSLSRLYPSTPASLDVVVVVVSHPVLMFLVGRVVVMAVVADVVKSG